MNSESTIHGNVAPGFERVKEEFAAVAAAEGGSLSAQLAAYHNGKLVVDLWTGPEIQSDSLLGAYSASKGAGALIVALLTQERILNLEEKVSHYWPEFAVNGKAHITLRELMSHRAGLVGSDEGFTIEQLADDRYVAARLGAQRPYWQPGSAFGYHALVMGALENEVVYRATGKTVQEIFSERVRIPYNIDFYLGLTEALDSRYLHSRPHISTPERVALLAARATAPDSITGVAFNRHHPQNPAVWELTNLDIVRRSGTVSFGGVASARGLAKMYAVSITSVDNKAPLLNPETVSSFSQIQSIGHDVVLKDFKAFAVGFHATSEYYPSLGQGAFGHSGAGGQQAFADPRNGLAYGYTRRQFPFPNAQAPENDHLVKALYAAIGQ